jgi:succinyl-CoA synthetase beta subunit
MLGERMYMRREMYVSIMLDRGAGGPIFIASPAGGTSIEDVAAATPELIFKQPIDIEVGVTDAQADFLATSLGFDVGGKGHTECKKVCAYIHTQTHTQTHTHSHTHTHTHLLTVFLDLNNFISFSYISFILLYLSFISYLPFKVLIGLYAMFRKHDCTLVEVNPLAETPDHRVVVCDAKINFDDNAGKTSAIVLIERVKVPSIFFIFSSKLPSFLHIHP